QNFDGKLGAAGVQLSLYNLGGGQLKGNYCYKKHETKIQLEGTVAGGKITLTETFNGMVTGYFIGKTDRENGLVGTWTDSTKTKAIPFNMHLEFAMYSPSFSHRYADLAET